MTFLMTEQAKFRRLLKLLVLLSYKRGYNISMLAERLGTSERTIFRYLNLFKEEGFIIVQTNGFYRLEKNESEFKDISQLLHFSEEEAYILEKAIHTIDDTNVFKSSLIRKLYALYDFKRIPHAIVKKEAAENIIKIIDAIENKKQVVLKDYKSAHGKTIRDRQVEPFGFTTNYLNIWCYDVESNSNKIFKSSRITEVVILGVNWMFEDKHKEGNLDIFRISGYDKIPVKLQMAMRATSLLTEEYPLAEKYISKINDNQYLFDGWVCDFKGITRFICGLYEEVDIIDPPELKDYLNKKINRMQKNKKK
jgi:proteasome accessory factor C